MTSTNFFRRAEMSTPRALDHGPSAVAGDALAAVRQVLARLASLRLTLLLLALLGVGIGIAYASAARTTWPLVVPLLLLAINLMAAVATNRVFRRQIALLNFHLALIALLLLIAAGRLTYLKGEHELTEGEEFAGQLTTETSGPWHPRRLDRVRFVNDGFTIEYAAGVRRGQTRNELRFVDESGALRSTVIGDNEPLVLYGYRFYTSPNKGFAPTFLWQPASGAAPLLGSVHLPSYPIHEYRQSQEWLPPGSRSTLWIMLQFDEVILDAQRPWAFHLPDDHRLVVRQGDARRELRVGESMTLPEGKLTYRGLRAWMGYTVFYDWTIHWLLAACVVAVASLAWHFWRKFAARPWDA